MEGVSWSGARRMPSRRPALILLPLLALTLLGSGPEGSERALLDAARTGDVEVVRSLLASGVDVNHAAGDGMTALHWAAERGDVEIVELLVGAGASVDPGTRIGHYTPLHLAGRSGSAAVVRILLEAGADLPARSTNSGATPVHLAAAAGNPAAVAALLDYGADPDAREGAWDQTPLVFAAANDRAEVIRVLLERGADPSLAGRVVDVPHRAALDQASNTRLREFLNELKEEAGGGDQWQPTPEQVQAAILASREILLDPEAEVTVEEEGEAEEDRVARYPDLVGSWGGLTPLLHAVRQGHVEATLALLEGGADVNQQADAGDRTSPLLMAAINGHFDLALLLLERGADPNLASDAGATPLHAVLERQWAPRSSYAHPTDHEQQRTTYLELTERLLEAGADPNVRLSRHLWYMQYTFDVLRINLTGATPFWRAAYAADVKAMRLLVAYGADPGLPTRTVPVRRRRYGGGPQEDHSGVPPVPVGGPAVHPIHAATGVGYGEGFAANAHRHVPGGWMPALRYLVEELGADVNVRDHNAYTPLHHAASRGDEEMVRYLVEHGADVTVVSRAGQTVADMANGPYERIQPFPGTVRLLESLGAHNNQNCVSC
jgi:uncharacterized protein